jgi:hypothetical protein
LRSNEEIAESLLTVIEDYKDALVALMCDELVRRGSLKDALEVLLNEIDQIPRLPSICWDPLWQIRMLELAHEMARTWDEAA